MDYKKLQLDTVLFNSEDIITTSGDSSDPIPEFQPQPVPSPGGQDGDSANVPV
ncbi:hypothetical protein [Gemelliphila palaticanis]|uniref:Uncharacterized protein n=1 Tax=Gemelliphila palaticanis TaxID=81950 RepID=A0ABX2T0A6_9BACL|nr:hypothetical protein [Gemella palaticanis]MBF0716151.1 hypothetical protein [Gemella palaticanis]NYS48081.1 hypothetical protein [Gemella palaticanis]